MVATTAPSASDEDHLVVADPSLPFSPGAVVFPRGGSRRALFAIAIALVGGLLVAAFAAYQTPGIGSFFAALTIVLTWIALARAHGRPLSGSERSALVVMGVLGAMPVWRSSSWLLTFDALLFGLGAVSLPFLARARAREHGFATTLSDLGGTLGNAVAGAVPLARRELALDDARARLKAPLVGLLVGLPLAGVFLTLFASADAVFSSLLERAFAVENGRTLARLIAAALFAWVALGIAWRAARVDAPLARAARERPLLGTTELLFGVLLIDLVFAAFVVVQGVQMAGFAEALLLPGVTYSAAAREGFFQLLAAAVLVATLVPVVDWLAAGAEARAVKHVRVALGALLALTVAVAVAALWRMALYTEVYGLTELRFHASALMLWLLAALSWMGLTVLRGERGRFLVGATTSLLAGVLFLHAINPDGLIARVNVNRPTTAVLDVDVAYLGRLSDDAVPVLAAGARGLDEVLAGRVCAVVDERAAFARRNESHWPVLSWSLALARAGDARCGG